ncbi:Scr1 family TA system antitoxin-like transcriptional regulator [Streptomyces sp. DSM 118878]
MGVPAGHRGTGALSVFGRQLKLFRERAGMDRARLGALPGYSASTVASFEQGRRIPPPKFIDRSDEVLDAGGVLSAGKEEVARAQYPAFFRDAAKLEGEAIELHVYANQAVPGLLQAEEYARAVFTTWRPLLHEDVVEQRVAARLARQEIFCRAQLRTLGFVIEESVLRRPLGGWIAMRGEERKPVREIEEQYGLLRAQALTPRESLAFVEKLLGER